MAENILSADILDRVVKYKEYNLNPKAMLLKIVRLRTYLEDVPSERDYTKPLFGVEGTSLFLNDDIMIFMKEKRWCFCYNDLEEIAGLPEARMFVDTDQLKWLFNNPLINPNPARTAVYNIKVVSKGSGCHISNDFSEGLFIPSEEMRLMAWYYHIFYRLPEQLSRNRQRLQ